MAKGLTSVGLTGLTANVGKRESARQDMDTLNRMYLMKKQEESEEQQAALAQQQYDSEVTKQAEGLLGPDRAKINAKARAMQADVKSKIKMFGGSKAKFMANGGLGIIGSYKDQILNSDELAIYKENKINLERIIKAKDAGKGHLLVPNDLKSSENYDKNKGGRISYSGLMTEIEIPPSNLFDRDEIITPTDVLKYGKNYTKIMGNYLLENPDETETFANLPRDEQWMRLRDYAYHKGYTGIGSDTTKMQLANSLAVAKSRQTKVGVDKSETSISGVLTRTDMNRISVPLSQVGVSKDNRLARQELFNTFGKNKWTSTAKMKPTMLEAGLEGLTLGMNDMDISFNLRDAYTVDWQGPITTAMFKTINGEDGIQYNEQGQVQSIKAESVPNLIDALGVPVKDIKGDLELKGMVNANAFELNGKEYIAIDARDQNGKYDKERTDSLYETDTGGTEPETYLQNLLVFKEKGKWGRTYYQKADMPTAKQSIFRNYLGDKVDDTTSEIKEQRDRETYLKNATQAVEYQEGVKPTLESDQAEFNSNLFEFQVKDYNINGGGSNRTNLMKAFYLSAAQETEEPNLALENLIKGNMFKSYLEQAGLTERDLANPEYTDNKILNALGQFLMNNSEPENEINNRMLFDRIVNYYKKLKTNA